MSGRRVARLLAAVLAAAVLAAALGACGSDGSTKAEDAAQDRAVAAANKVEKQNLEKMKAALRKKWQARARARRAAAVAAARRRQAQRAVRGTVAGGGGNVSAADICAPIHTRLGGRAGKAEHRWRLLQRRKVLAYLNLSCT